jgi:hypothetical protein
MNNSDLPVCVFMPDGKPAPAVLTAEEAVAFLRLDGSGGLRTLKYYRDEGLLIGVRIGHKVRYPLSEIMRFLNQKVELSRSVGLRSHR